MIQGQIALNNFQADVHDGEMNALGEDGKPTGEKVPIKLLRVQDVNSKLVIDLVFTPDQLEQFAEHVGRSTRKIIDAAPSFDHRLRNIFTRNGKIKG
jgi:hypothetical protein